MLLKSVFGFATAKIIKISLCSKSLVLYIYALSGLRNPSGFKKDQRTYTGDKMEMRREAGVGGQSGPDDIAAPQLNFFRTSFPTTPSLRIGRRGLSTTSSLRDSESVTICMCRSGSGGLAYHQGLHTHLYYKLHHYDYHPPSHGVAMSWTTPAEGVQLAERLSRGLSSHPQKMSCGAAMLSDGY